MPFYTLIQGRHSRDNPWPTERFLVVEARNQEEANVRALYYGVDFLTITPTRDRMWVWSGPYDLGTPTPSVGNETNLDYWKDCGGWVVLYLNGNLRSSMADDQELFETVTTHLNAVA